MSSFVNLKNVGIFSALGATCTLGFVFRHFFYSYWIFCRKQILSGSREEHILNYEEELRRLTKENLDVKSELQKQIKLRNEERIGRTAAEKKNRRALQNDTSINGFRLHAIGYVVSCYVDRRGTPRQGLLVPSGRARIEMTNSICPTSLECLEEYSHVWIIFIFHENTNIVKKKNKGNQTPMAKISPPRLGGKKVGLFSTRTPHRPNSIGLTLARITSVNKRTIQISGHDLVDGTPVLDVKPYVPSDCMVGFKCPQWVSADTEIIKRKVEFTPSALKQLDETILNQSLRFYQTLTDVKNAIEEMLVLDIRGVHQGRGKKMETDSVYECYFDCLRLEFTATDEEILVTKIISTNQV